MKNATILKFKDRPDHGNGGGCILVVRLYTLPNNAGKTDKEGDNPEVKTTANPEGATSTTDTAKIKHKVRGEEEFKGNKIKPGKTPNHST